MRQRTRTSACRGADRGATPAAIAAAIRLGLRLLPGLVAGAVGPALATAGEARAQHPVGAGTAGGAVCRPWPDEPSPLPAVWSDDPVAATWARDRVDALSDEATTAEGHDLDLALRLWQRVLCLDPENIAAADALERSAALPGPVLTPGAAVAEAPAPGPGGLPPVSAAPPAAVAAAAEPLSSGWPFTLEVLPPYSPPPDPVRGDLAVLGEVDQELSEIRQLTEEAHFRTALAVARATGELLDRAGEGPAVDVRRARLELLSATAAVALGRDDEARTHMMAALAHDPTLTLDAGSTSPKVLALLREVRSETAQRPTAPAIAGAEGRP